MFSGSVRLIENTRIFARHSGTQKQFLVYSMAYTIGQEMAIILPLPVGSHDEDTAVRFISLSNYPGFFNDMFEGFPTLPIGFSTGTKWTITLSRSSTLKVRKVGAYDASFVPTLHDFDRLDSRFKLPNQVWDRLPEYKDYGFAVFKLRVPTNRNWKINLAKLNPFSRSPESFPVLKQEAHPMAFEFITRLRDTLFFPTVHVHDGLVHKQADFDHILY
jgi:hypothetical protein